MIILGTNSIKDTGYDVANSCRFNDGSSDALIKTLADPGGAGNRNKWTFSTWLKRGALGSEKWIFGSYQTNSYHTAIRFNSDDTLDFFDVYNGSFNGRRNTNRVFRDISAWYHIVCIWDKDNSTSDHKMRVYVNGTEETSFATSSAPSNATTLNADGQDISIGQNEGQGNYFDGYMCETVFNDGQAYTADNYGEFDSDSPTIWKPIDVSGLTFGTTGFYLDFEDSSNLGNDANGGTDFTENNITATDQTTDTCTNNFATLNPLMNNLNNLPTLSEGNLEVLAVSGSTWSVTPSTIGLPKKGKWVFEVEAVSGTSGDRAAFAGWINPAVSNPLANGSILWRNIASTNSILSNDSAATGSFSATTWGTNGHIIGMYIDMDNSKLYFAHNGTIQNSGTGIDFQGTFDDDTFILPVVMVINTDKLSVNFGNPATNFAIASGNTDVNGFGNFEFNPSAGTFDGASKDFLAICTKNLAGVS